jgi:phage terminase large subunit
MDQVITIPYRPREHQLAIHDAVDSHRFAVAVCHRRFGKTVAAINQIIKAAVLCGRDNPRYAVVCPTYTQAKRVAWDYVTQYTRPLDPKVNISELRVDFMGRRISLYGADNPDSLRGIYLDGVVLDEVGDMNPKIWTEILRPSLADRMGWALFIGTPKGQNHFKELRDRAETEEDWALLEFKASETNILPKPSLRLQKRKWGMTSIFKSLNVHSPLRSRVVTTGRYLTNSQKNALRKSQGTTSAKPLRLGSGDGGLYGNMGCPSRGPRGQSYGLH